MEINNKNTKENGSKARESSDLCCREEQDLRRGVTDGGETVNKFYSDGIWRDGGEGQFYSIGEDEEERSLCS